MQALIIFFEADIREGDSIRGDSWVGDCYVMYIGPPIGVVIFRYFSGEAFWIVVLSRAAKVLPVDAADDVTN